MSVEAQKQIWQESWKSQGQISPEDILSSDFAKAAHGNVKRFLDAQDRLILEAGCGTGRLCCLIGKDFPHSLVVGVDITEESLRIAERLKNFLKVDNVSFIKADLFALPYPDNSFDVVFNDGVIEHFALEHRPNYKDALHEMRRVVRPGGKIIVDVPNYYCFVHTLYKWALRKTGRQYPFGYEKSFTKKELVALFKEYDLGELSVRGYYPAHGFFRLSGYAKLFSLLGRIVNRFDNPFISNAFGFMIIIKGVKK